MIYLMATQKNLLMILSASNFDFFFNLTPLSFNVQHNRIGTLFQTPFKRSHIENEAYFTKIILYIHLNPQKHKIIPDFRNWTWSSYNKILLPEKSKLMKKEVLEWFGGFEMYIKSHLDAREIISD